MTWLNKIQAELEAVTETEENSVEPEYCVRTNDHIIGTANSQLRKLYYLYQKSVAEEQTAKIATKEKSISRKEYLSRINEVNKLLVIREALGVIFWASCINDFPELIGRQLIGIRHGWRVVWCEDEVPRMHLHFIDEE